jgi:circadian clock protein KaiC
LIGAAGVGKSSLALTYAIAAAGRGERSVFFAFDEGRATIEARAHALGMDLLSAMESGLVRFQQIDPAEMSPGEFAANVRRSVEQDNARVVVIDSLNGYLNAMPDARFLTAQLHELLSYLNQRGVATFLVAAQSNLIGAPTRSPIDASYLADTVVMLRMYEHQGNVRKAISVLKKRSGRHEDSIRRLWFDAQGLHLSEPLHHLRGVLAGVPEDIDLPASPPADRAG